MQTGIEFTVVELVNGVCRVCDVERVSVQALPACALPAELDGCLLQKFRDACELLGLDCGEIAAWKAFVWSSASGATHVSVMREPRTGLAPGVDLLPDRR